MYQLWEDLKRLKSYRWVELSHPLNNNSPYWGGIPDGSVELCTTVYDWGNPMLECTIQTFKFPSQLGTHIDFPGHFIKGATGDGPLLRLCESGVKISSPDIQNTNQYICYYLPIYTG